ncbi:hypothetical protein C8R42DRAFT_647539 [Lentinula raphanica]|nr:hypothetical protein C8R42DRAFT_647539 [Lentinula raphanica]
MTPGQRIGEGYNLDDENDSTAWTKTTRGCGQGYESPERLKRNWFIEELQSNDTRIEVSFIHPLPFPSCSTLSRTLLIGTRGTIVKQRHADMDSNGDRDENDSTTQTRTNRRRRRGRLDGVDEDDSTNVGKDIQDDNTRIPELSTPSGNCIWDGGASGLTRVPVTLRLSLD